jgi:hypothetical protein
MGQAKNSRDKAVDFIVSAQIKLIPEKKIGYLYLYLPNNNKSKRVSPQILGIPSFELITDIATSK